MERHFLKIIGFFISGISLSRFLAWKESTWLLLVIVAFISQLVVVGYKRKETPWVLVLCAALLGGLWYELSLYPQGLYDHWEGQEVTGAGVILTYPQEGQYYTTFILKPEGIGVENSKLYGIDKILVKSSGTMDQLMPGDTISYAGQLFVPRGARNPGEFDYQKYLANQQIFYGVKCTGQNCTIKRRGTGLVTRVAQQRMKITGYLERILPETEKGLILGILFGDTGTMAEAEKQGFQKAGVLHLFAVSGFHVSLVLGSVWFLLSFREIKAKNRLLLGIIVLVIYNLLVGWTASLLRSSIMAVLGLLALTVKKNKDGYTSLGIAALVILLINPGDLFQAGFQLSFVVTLGIIHLTPHLNNWGMGKGRAVLLTAYFSSLPLTAYYFNQISLVGPIVNMFAATFCGVAAVLALAGSCLTILYIPLAKPFFLASGSVIYLLEKLVLWWAARSWACITVATPPVLIIGLYYVILFTFPFMLRFRWVVGEIPGTGKAILCLGLCMVLIGLYFQPATMEVVFLDVGQGDSIFIHTPQDHVILLDGGGTPYTDFAVGKNILLPFLHHRGVRKIDVMIMSHNHLDHSEGLLELLDLIPVGAFLMPPAEGSCEIEEKIKAKCQAKQIPVYELTKGQAWEIEEEVKLEVLHPSREQGFLGNNNSLVVNLKFKKVNWLLTGDVENEGIEQFREKSETLRADVLKIPHHGSVTSYDVTLYEKVRPQLAIISVGMNKFGQPHSTVVDYFKDQGIPLLITREHGAIITSSDGSKLKVRCFCKD